ncbi:WD repeat-containing protein 61-like [Papilio machaon]|uniref:WD repeat-containing protein 61-like n=1 Tax=Papilio machaon TaxID=76193 RepID=UPI001E664BFE|nr:WD repeat-containing protein 61-like [Papilio machaon]
MPAAAVYSLLIKRENAHEDSIYTCAWTQTNISAEAKEQIKHFLVTGGLDGLIKVWHIENNKLELFHTLQGHCMAVVSIAISSDGHTIASASLDSTMMIWDLMSGNKVHEIQSEATDVWKVAFSPNNTHVVSGSHTGKVIIYNIVKGIVHKTLDTRGKFTICVAWSADDKYISSGAVDGTVCIFDVQQGKLIHTIEAHTKTVRSVQFSTNSNLLVTASDDGYVKVYDSASANLVKNVNLKSWVLNACFSKDGTRIAAATADGSVYVILLTDCKILKQFKEHSSTVWDVKFKPTSDHLVSVSKDKCINVYECPIPTKDTKK